LQLTIYKAPLCVPVDSPQKLTNGKLAIFIFHPLSPPPGIVCRLHRGFVLIAFL